MSDPGLPGDLNTHDLPGNSNEDVFIDGYVEQYYYDAGLFSSWFGDRCGVVILLPIPAVTWLADTLASEWECWLYARAEEEYYNERR